LGRWWLLQIRQAVTEFAILPLGSQLAHERLPHIKSLLLYGAPSTGKTMVAQVWTDRVVCVTSGGDYDLIVG
jgi:ATP-dependent 26S proteasome regulatory subunit